MKALKRFLTALLSLCITIVITSWSALAILGSATAINKLIVASGSYETAATQTRSAILTSASIPEQYRAPITQAFENSITAKQIETIVQPLLVDIVGWLDQPAGTPAPQLVVNLSPVKQQLERELDQVQLTEIEKAALTAQVGKQIPDQLDLAQAQGLATQQGVDAQAASPAAGASAALETFKAVYGTVQVVAVVGLVVMLVLLLAVIVLSRRDGRAMLRRPSWAFVSAGLLATLIWLVARLLQPDQAQPALSVAVNVAREVSAIIVWYSLSSVVFGVALYGLSLLIKKPISSPSAAPIAAPPTTSIEPPSSPTQNADSLTDTMPR